MPKARGFFAGSKIRKEAPARSIPQCGACGLHKKCTHPKMEVYGMGARRILIVGERPTTEEDAEGLHFMDKPNRYLKGILRGLGVNVETDTWKTNAIICRPPGKPRGPTNQEIVQCRPNIMKAIKELKPNVIIPLGSAAVSAVIGGVWKEGTGPMLRWAGWTIPCQVSNAWVCPTWAPSFVMKQDDPVITKQFQDHLKQACALSEQMPWPEGKPNWEKGIKKVFDPVKAAAWLRKAVARKDGAIAWDYETNMLKPDGPDARIVSCAVAWGREEPEQCIAFPWHGEAVTAMQELLKSPIPKIASNLKFEDRWTRKEFGHRVKGWAWDTMLAAHVLDNRPGITSVKFQSYIHLGTPVWNANIEPFLKSKGDETTNAIFSEIDINDLLLYNGLDALLEFKVAVKQIRKLDCAIPWRI